MAEMKAFGKAREATVNDMLQYMVDCLKANKTAAGSAAAAAAAAAAAVYNVCAA